MQTGKVFKIFNHTYLVIIEIKMSETPVLLQSVNALKRQSMKVCILHKLGYHKHTHVLLLISDILFRLHMKMK